MMIVGIIPARYGSKRFPGKPLAMIGNMTMIERVYRQATQSVRLTSILVATDDERVYNEVRRFGGQVVMTSVHHRTGTERCAEAIRVAGLNPDAIVNIQGDEPFIHPRLIDEMARLIEQPHVSLATLIRKAGSMQEVQSPDKVKVIINRQMQALYFSRQPIPFYPDEVPFEKRNYYIHCGIYAYRWTILQEIVKLKDSYLEAAESLEQLRWLEYGWPIWLAITSYDSHAVDSPRDVETLKAIYGF
jgi:3-deoxy-manno-octulosonate cytidylyltransferase (CMP-KDO synthetase)